jgi:hypothetical protein
MDDIQHRLSPRICTNLPQIEAERIAVMNTVAKMRDVLCGLAPAVYLTQNGVANVSTAVIYVRKVTEAVYNKKGRSSKISPNALFKSSGGAFKASGSSLFRTIPRRRATPETIAKLIAIGINPNLA